MRDLTLVGSTTALTEDVVVARVSGAQRLCLLATAAAFASPLSAADALRALLGRPDADLVVAGDRGSCEAPETIERLDAADLVIALDGSALHARAMWRASALGAALAQIPLVAVGTVASVLGATMIDPRGGAPTTGLGLFDAVVVGTRAAEEQSRRTRSLLGSGLTYVEMGPHSVIHYDGTWRVEVDGGLRVTRGDEVVAL